MLRTQATDVVHRLVEYMHESNLKVGQKLPSVRDLAKRLGISRHVVRDGILRAQTMGIVSVLPRSGVFVRSLDYSALVGALSETVLVGLRQEDPSTTHLWDAREAIEIRTAARAARRRAAEDIHELASWILRMEEVAGDRQRFVATDEQFHLAIARVAGNPVLVTMLRSVLTLLRPYRVKAVVTDETMRTTHAEHREIFTPIREGDDKMAVEAISRHLQQFERRLFEQVDGGIRRIGSQAVDETRHPHTG